MMFGRLGVLTAFSTYNGFIKLRKICTLPPGFPQNTHLRDQSPVISIVPLCVTFPCFKNFYGLFSTNPLNEPIDTALAHLGAFIYAIPSLYSAFSPTSCPLTVF